ncbi:chemotaxis protein CheW [Methyloferula stellata]|uniref:chemotaxis protein CheW n=1 Tax=Methyloferula stellata TaxID=876270 RepID=UPI000372903E|nr:chemotaxis protein CheW [Methyloferula stellata]
MPEAETFAKDGGARDLLFWQSGRCWAIPAERAVKVIPTQAMTHVPFLPPEVSGVIAIGGKVVPVLDLKTMLGLHEPEPAEAELVLVAIGAETYALHVERVLQIAAAADRWHDKPVHRIDLDDLIEQHLRANDSALMGFASFDTARLDAASHESPSRSPAANPPAARQQTTMLGVRGAALAVETASSYEFLPLDLVTELSESLPVAAVPDPSPVFAGAAFFRDRLLPVVCLDALLGRAPAEPRARSAYVIVDADGHSCALAVKSVIGLVPDAESESLVDLRQLLQKLLPDAESGSASSMSLATQSQEAQANSEETRYLLVELAGQNCAFALTSVAHIHAGCRVVPAPAIAGSAAIEVTAIGGRVLPVLDLAALLGLAAAQTMTHFIELRSQQTGPFLVAVARVAGIVTISNDALIPPPEAGAINAMARQGTSLVWILDASLIAEEGGWRRDAA